MLDLSEHLQSFADEAAERDKVYELLKQGKYDQALKLEPKAEYVLARFVQGKVAAREYQAAIRQFDNLRDAASSGVAYTAYPQLVLAFEQTGT